MEKRKTKSTEKMQAYLNKIQPSKQPQNNYAVYQPPLTTLGWKIRWVFSTNPEHLTGLTHLQSPNSISLSHCLAHAFWVSKKLCRAVSIRHVATRTHAATHAALVQIQRSIGSVISSKQQCKRFVIMIRLLVSLVHYVKTMTLVLLPPKKLYLCSSE